MAAVESLCKIINIEPSRFTKNENILIEAELFFFLCQQLSDFVGAPYKHYFSLIKDDNKRSNIMLEQNFVKCLVNDILISGAYTVEGIAYYTGSPDEVIYDIMAGTNTSPSLSLARRVFELHREIRPELYSSIMKKLLTEYEPESH